MDKWIKTKWRGDWKETSEIKNSGKHVFPYGFDMDRLIKKTQWRGDWKETSEIKNSGTQLFPMVLKWKR